MEVNPYLSVAERELLGRAVVGIAGVGGLGSNCAMHLVRSGIRTLVLADRDRVTGSNLNRQFFFANQIGCRKIEAIEKTLRNIVPELELELHDSAVTSQNAAAWFGRCDIVVEAFDSVSAKQMLIRTMLACGKTVVAASGLGGWGKSNELHVCRMAGGRLYLVGDCKSCAETGDDRPFSPRVGIAAAMEANTVIALLLGQKP